MKRASAVMFGLLSVATVFAVSPPVAGAEGDRPVLLCAVMQVQECVRGLECVAVLPEEINSPVFFRIDTAAGVLSTTEASGRQRSSPIKYMESINGRLILQGVEATTTAQPDGVGWTFAIDDDNGRLTASASGPDVGFVMFGACTPI